MSSTGSNNNGEVPTVLVRDSNGSALLCFLEQLIPIENNEYALSTTDMPYEKIVFETVEYEKADFYLNLIQGPGLQALRLITDLHNGRFFGFIVMIIFVIASICNVFLALSGSYMTLRPFIIKKYIKHKNFSSKK